MLTDTIRNIIIAGAGSFVGGALRYAISLIMKGVGRGFPWTTLTVNLAGCFLIGLLWGLFSRSSSADSTWALFLTVGVCGGFTTFSTFSKESLILLQGGNIWGFISYVALSIVAGIALVAAGYCLAR